MINWFDMPAEGLSNGGLFEVKELTATENKVYQKDGEVYNKVTVNVEGGGGSSDFSTAEVTVVDNVGRNILLPIIMDDDGQELHSILNLGISESGDYIVPLYKSSLIGRVNEGSGSVSVTGSIAYLNGMIIVTGDGTITIS